MLVDGVLREDELAELTGFRLPEGPYETLAGFLMARLGHIPVGGRDDRARAAGSSPSSRSSGTGSSRCASSQPGGRADDLTCWSPCVLLLGNAFFVGGEFALIASRRTVIEPLAATSRRARMALSAMNQIPLMIAGAQLGITICSLGLGAIAEPALAHLLEGPFHAVGAAGAAPCTRWRSCSPSASWSSCTRSSARWCRRTSPSPGRSAPRCGSGPPMLAFCVATKPLLVAMKWASRQVLRLWRIEATDAVKTVFTAEELAGLVAQARTEGLLGAGGARAHHRRAGAARPHRRRRAAALVVGDHGGRRRVAGVARGAGHPHRPVALPGRAARDPAGARLRARQGRARVRGASRRAPIPAEVVRPLAVVPPDRTLADLLLAMRRERRHIVLVSDGRAPLGVVTLDDVLNAVGWLRSVHTRRTCVIAVCSRALIRCCPVP